MKDPGVEFIHTRQSKRLRHHYETDVLFFTEYRGQTYTSLLRKGRNPQDTNRAMARALALRVGLSIALFLFILLSWSMGWVRPSGLPVGP